MSNYSPFDTNKKNIKNYILVGGSIIDPKNKQILKSDIYIKNNLIEKIGNDLKKNVK